MVAKALKYWAAGNSVSIPPFGIIACCWATDLVELDYVVKWDIPYIPAEAILYTWRIALAV